VGIRAATLRVRGRSMRLSNWKGRRVGVSGVANGQEKTFRSAKIYSFGPRRVKRPPNGGEGGNQKKDSAKEGTGCKRLGGRTCVRWLRCVVGARRWRTGRGLGGKKNYWDINSGEFESGKVTKQTYRVGRKRTEKSINWGDKGTRIKRMSTPERDRPDK